MKQMRRLIWYPVFFLLMLSLFSAGAWAAQIKDSESATHGVDASKYYIVDTYEFPGFKLIQLELPVLSIYSYMLISDGEALVVDPCPTYGRRFVPSAPFEWNMGRFDG